MKIKNRRLIFGFRFYALLDVLFSRMFELTTYHRESTIVKSNTKFDKDELLNVQLSTLGLDILKNKRKPKS